MKIIEFILELFNKMVVILKDIECIKKNKDMLVSFFSKIYLIVPAILFITCLSTIPSFFDFINGINNEYLTRSITFLKTNAFTIVVICFSIICLMFMYKARQAGASKANKEKIETDLAKNIHDNIVHKIRNDIKTLDDLKERKIASVNANNELAIKHGNESIERELRTRTKEYVNNLSDFFSKYYAYTISACIKLVDFENEVDKKLVERRATTIARSKNTASKRRKEYETVTIGEYPDFTYLCEGTHTFYGKADLKKADDYKLPNKAELDEALSK